MFDQKFPQNSVNPIFLFLKLENLSDIICNLQSASVHIKDLSNANFLLNGNQILQLNHSFLMYSFSTPWKHQKTVRFSDVFRG